MSTLPLIGSMSTLHLVFTLLIAVVAVTVTWFAGYVVYRLLKQNR
ncbi:hypothetical protein [Litorihabitans aurantiacus]|uniref:Uncharacterized protein n=1 Tax=Litorihabitans aurantiacus TaxID=1930061 RepID=A0AA37UJE7_9MICO|nr:hypothetical protein [Litorihabitans aurantiacus]GMA30265.1 hypothetical protein GCM10025875_02570 [Litorihabitans aurantiacus]